MSATWLKREVLVTVKAYPNPSARHFETVCVAAVTAEEGWIRLYPVHFRSLPEDQRFKKYQRVRLLMKKHERDQRPESYQPDENSFELLQVVESHRNWHGRWQWIRPTVGPSMCEIIRLQKSTGRSLGCIAPRAVDDLEVENADATWSGRKRAAMEQIQLFDPIDTKLEKIPFVFRYKYRCEDRACRGHSQSIIDWELMELYRKVKAKTPDHDELLKKIRQKYLDELCGVDKHTHFFVGNHSMWPGSFMVLGVFWPPRRNQIEMF
jgi:hypothetical protein